MNSTPPHPVRRFGGPLTKDKGDFIDGVLIVDKPPGPTSHDIVAGIRRRFGIRKVGHGGTLDPQATGVLIILLGRGTKLSSRFIGSDKSYEGVMKLGVATDSHDADGTIVKEGDCGHVTREQIEAETRKMTGDLLQTPPMISAAKVDGVPLYKAARKGLTVERKAKLIHVYEFTLKDFDRPCVSFSIRCSKGTYVRTLCADIGEALGCGAHLQSLRRTQSGEMRIEDALSMEAVMNMTRDELRAKILPMSRFAAKLAGLPEAGPD